MIAYGKSDRGSVRPTNQDAYAIDLLSDAALLAVCDGMGGANAGNVASRFAIETFMASLRGKYHEDMEQKECQAILRDSVDEANRTVFELAQAQPEFRGMGTTLIGGIVLGGRATLANVGDSRAYRVTEEQASRMTQDHSYVEEMMRRGKLTAEAARVHPNKNLITRAIGIEPEVECDIYEETLEAGEILLLCSDGLSGVVEEEEMADSIRKADSLQNGADALVELALKNGSTDNITIVLYSSEPFHGKE